MEVTSNQPAGSTELHFLDYWRVIRIRKSVIIIVLLLVVMTVTVVTFLLPPVYRSTARISVEKDAPDIGTMGGQAIYQGFDPYFLSTQFEIIQSKSVLYPVIERLDLNRQWAKRYGGGDALKQSDTIRFLQAKLGLRKSRDTSLIEINVDHEDPVEAAQLANVIAEVYKEVRLKQFTDRSGTGISKLEEDYARATADVTAVQDKVDKLRSELEVTDISTDATGSSLTLEPETLRRLEAARVTAQTDFIQWNSLYSSLTNMSPAELRMSVISAYPDSQLASLLQAIDSAEVERISLSKDYGEKHPDMERVTGMIATLNSQVEERLRGHMGGLLARVNASKAQMEELSRQVESAKAREFKTAAQGRDYYDTKRNLESLKRMQEALRMKIMQEKIDSQLPRGSIVQIHDPAEPDFRPVAPKKGLLIGASVVIGLALGIGLAFFIEYLDTSVKTIDDVERALGAPVLGVIPQNVGSLLEEGEESPHAEPYRVLRSNMLFTKKDGKFNTFCVSSAGAGEGKSTTIFNLACAFAQNGQRVIIVDSDLRRPSLQRLFKVSNAVGLTNYLLRQNSLEEVIQTTSLPTLDFLPSGRLPSSSVGILNSAQMRALVHELKRRYDYVFFDSPPILGVSDASILVSEMDMTLLVVQYRKYPQAMTLRAKQMIEKVGGNLIGVVLNNINMTHDSYYYYYSGFYSNYYATPDPSQKVLPEKGGPEDGGEQPNAEEKLESKY